MNQISWTPPLFRTVSHGIPTRSSPKRPTFALLMSKAVTLLLGLFPPQHPKVYHLRVSTAKVTPSFYILSQFILVCKCQVQQSHLHSLAPQSPVSGNCHQSTLQTSYISCVFLCCPSNRCQGSSVLPMRTKGCESEAFCSS